jgi:hypothetical protein
MLLDGSGRMRKEFSRTNGGKAYLLQRLVQGPVDILMMENQPRQESNQEAQPSEEENSSIFVERV